MAHSLYEEVAGGVRRKTDGKVGKVEIGLE